MKEEEWNTRETIIDFTEEEYKKLLADKKLYTFKNGKAAGPDGWTEEAARTVIACGEKQEKTTNNGYGHV